jgi:DNA-binding response OmpR family regulator
MSEMANAAGTLERRNVVLLAGSQAMLDALTQPIANLDYSVLAAGDTTTALSTAAKNQPDLAVLCVDSLGPAAFDLCRQLRSSQDPVILLLSASADPQAQARAFEQQRVGGFGAGQHFDGQAGQVGPELLP